VSFLPGFDFSLVGKKKMFSILSIPLNRVWAMLEKWSLPLILGLSSVLFSITTVLHFLHHGSLLEFLIGMITLVPISAIIRSATRDLALRLQVNDYEFLGGLVNGILGYATQCLGETY
jgi:hypothetical protein